jgi:DNA-binding transcriptional MerR regulator
MEAATTPTPEKPLTIGAVCRELREEFEDISISKIRYLEDQRLLEPRRTQGGYRLYTRADVERLRRILQLQRDEFLPLRVIREELDGEVARAAAGGARRRRAASGGPGEEESRLTRDELLEQTGATPDYLRELEDFGLVSGGSDGSYAAGEVDIVRICLRMTEYGLGARHLRQFHSGIQRIAGLVEQILAPQLRARNPDRREAGLEELRELAGLAADLSEQILVRDVGRLAS